MIAEVRVLVPVPVKVDLSDQPPEWNRSLLRAWLVPSVQPAASDASVPAISKDGLATPLVAARATRGDQTTKIIAVSTTRTPAAIVMPTLLINFLSV